MSPEGHSGLIVVGLLGVLTLFAFSIGLTFWGAAVARQRTGRWWRFAAVLPLAGAAVGSLGLLVTAMLLVSTFQGLSELEPELRQGALTSGISHAMRAMEGGSIVFGLSYVVSLLSNLIGTLRRQSPGA
jgi:hypothetical protein